MGNKFKNIFLVCLEFGDELNHVIARNPSLKKARHAADLAKKRWPNKEIYITVEKVLEQEDDYYIPESSNTDYCICGNEEGGCLSNLSCRCPAIAKCKQMKMDIDPFRMPTKKKLLEPTEINIISIRRGIIEIVIPDWDPEETIGLSPNEIPRDIMPYLEAGVVLEADVNLNAGSADALVLKNLRLVYEDEDEEENEKVFFSREPMLNSFSYYANPLSSPFEEKPKELAEESCSKLPEATSSEDDEDYDEEEEDEDYDEEEEDEDYDEEEEDEDYDEEDEVSRAWTQDEDEDYDEDYDEDSETKKPGFVDEKFKINKFPMQDPKEKLSFEG